MKTKKIFRIIIIFSSLLLLHGCSWGLKKSYMKAGFNQSSKEVEVEEVIIEGDASAVAREIARVKKANADGVFYDKMAALDPGEEDKIDLLLKGTSVIEGRTDVPWTSRNYNGKSGRRGRESLNRKRLDAGWERIN